MELHTGYLHRKGRTTKIWKKSWFVLRSDRLLYFASKRSHTPKAEIRFFSGAFVEDGSTLPEKDIKNNIDCHFEVLSKDPEKTWHLYADSTQEKEKWLQCLTQTLLPFEQNFFSNDNIVEDISQNHKESCSKIEINFNCNKLIDMDTFSKSDPMVFVFAPNVVGNQNSGWHVVWKSEVIMDNLNPEWVESYNCDYYFDAVQPLLIKVYDIDDFDHLDKFENHDLLGETQIDVAELVSAPSCQLTKPLKLPNNPSKFAGTITLRAEELVSSNSFCRFRFRAYNLDKKDFFGKSDPFFVISKTREDGQFVQVYKSEVVMKELSPVWQTALVPLSKLCNGDTARPLKIEVFDWNRSGAHDYIGEFESNVDTLCSKKSETVDINNKGKVGRRGYKNSGNLGIIHCAVEKRPSFLDFLSGGLEIALSVAVDFTASNGDPRNPNSLHNYTSRAANQYQTAIGAVGQVLSYYDTDGMIPAFGFGGILPGANKADHCFPLSLDSNRVELHGIDEILREYYSAIQHVKLAGPTIFAQIINNAIEEASQHVSQDNQQYFVLLIITDGVINDMEQTVNAIVTASKLPLSIIIVGVGNADFEKMDVLDADDEPLISTTGEVMQRDIVQFVPFRDFLNKPPAALASAVLEEVPGQVLSFMASKQIKPNEPKAPVEYNYNDYVPQQDLGNVPPQEFQQNVDNGPPKNSQYSDFAINPELFAHDIKKQASDNHIERKKKPQKYNYSESLF